MRRVVLFLAATLVAGLFTGIPAASASPGGAGCHLSGTASFSKGLGQTAQDVVYKFTGKLDNCQSSVGSYKSATISAKGKGSLSCGQGTSAGVATVKWDNGKKSVVPYTTTSFAALVIVQGTVKSGEFAGQGSIGTLAFEANAPDCFGAGVKTANFDGFDGYGSYQ
jgi:hypothetical protein